MNERRGCAAAAAGDDDAVLSINYPHHWQLLKLTHTHTPPTGRRPLVNCIVDFTCRIFTKAQMRKFFLHYESANKLPRKRNIDRYREPQQRFAKPQTGLFSCTVGVAWTAFDIVLADRKSAFKWFNSNNQATSFPNLLNFRPTISEFTLLKRAIFAAIRPQFDDDLHSPRWRFQTYWTIAILISAE